jgi:hypothetical protein
MGCGLIQEDEKINTPSAPSVSLNKSNISQKSGSVTQLRSKTSMKSTNSQKTVKDNSSDNSRFSNKIIINKPLDSS